MESSYCLCYDYTEQNILDVVHELACWQRLSGSNLYTIAIEKKKRHSHKVHTERLY